MFKRLVFEDYATICTLIAFIVAASVFIATVWRAIRMPKSQVDRFANLPFDSASPRHDNRA